MPKRREPNFSHLSIGVSVSESADLAQLGFLESHLRLALGEIARTILVHGGTIVYGGHLLAGGYTPFLVRELERYANPDRPLRVCLSWSEHAMLDRNALAQRASEYGLYATVTYLDIQGREMHRDGQAAPVETISREDRIQSLTAMRRYVTEICDCRILLGGKLRDYQGAVPGLIEEAILALENDTPLLLAGGFGGATLEIIRSMDPEFAAWFPQKLDREWKPTEEVRGALRRLHELWTIRRSAQLDLLSAAETAQLSATHRASEIATLVGQALNRIEDAGTSRAEL